MPRRPHRVPRLRCGRGQRGMDARPQAFSSCSAASAVSCVRTLFATPAGVAPAPPPPSARPLRAFPPDFLFLCNTAPRGPPPGRSHSEAEAGRELSHVGTREDSECLEARVLPSALAGVGVPPGVHFSAGCSRCSVVVYQALADRALGAETASPAPQDPRRPVPPRPLCSTRISFL